MPRLHLAETLIKESCEEIPSGLYAVERAIDAVNADTRMEPKLKAELTYALHLIHKKVSRFEVGATALGLNPNRR